MSLFSSLTTAVSGLNAQSRALGHIADNVANSQTLGYKRLDTSFEDMLAFVGREPSAGGVTAQADATNDVQGDISQVENPLALALNGRGFFSVARPVGPSAGGVTRFDAREMFSRAGDFQLNAEGYLVNGSGDVLQGWLADAGGAIDSTRLQPIQADRSGLAPVPTAQVTLSANLPAAAAAGTTGTTETQVYDRLGTLQTLDLTWTPTTTGTPPVVTPNSWQLDIRQPGAATALGSYTVTFGSNGAPAGTIGQVTAADGTVLGTYDAANPANASVAFTGTFGGVAQPLTLDLGRFGSTEGVTQYAGATYELRSVDQDGAPAGAFASLAVRDDGQVVASYDNGESRTIAQVPVVTFADPDALDRLSGQAFGLTREAGLQQVVPIGASGSGTLETGAVEGSNVDVAAEFTKLIVAQRAYSANTKIVTTSDEMLQETINLKR